MHAMGCKFVLILAHALVFVIFSLKAMAGGDYTSGKVNSFFQLRNGTYEFTFTPDSDLINGCKEFKVSLKYDRIPWYSWLPFTKTSHPSRQATEKAMIFIHEAFLSNKEIFFGYIGNGLQSYGDKCSFKSKGLELRDVVVYSFYDPV